MANIGCVHRVPLFSNLAKDEQSGVQNLLHHKTFQKGEIVFSPDSQEQLSIVSVGAMRIYKLSRTGKEQLIRIVREGEYDGENYLFGLTNETLYAEAIKETKVCILFKSDFNKLIELYPQLGCKLLQLNALKSLEVEKQLQLLAIDHIEDRLASYLSQLSLATSPESISRKLKVFQEKGLINRKGKKIQLLKSFWEEFDFL